MLESEEFKEASKEDQMLLADFKPQRSISLDRAHPERRRNVDEKVQNENIDNSVQSMEQKEPEEAIAEQIKDSKDFEKVNQEELEEVVDELESPNQEQVEVSKTDFASELASKILEGWRRSGNRGMISPEGTRFRTKRQAIEHLVKVGGSEEHVEALRDLCVEEEGWTREKLPKGWLGKERDKVLFFISARLLVDFLYIVDFSFQSYNFMAADGSLHTNKPLAAKLVLHE